MIRDFDRQLKGKNLIGAEIGVFKGQHAAMMLFAANIKFLFLIDTWEDFQRENLAGIEVLEDSHYRLRVWRDKCLWLKETSVNTSKLLADDSLDFVYIDALHNYKDVLEDLKAWFPKVKTGGLFGGHDYHSHPEVKKAVDDFIAGKDIALQVSKLSKGNINPFYDDWWFIK